MNPKLDARLAMNARRSAARANRAAARERLAAVVKRDDVVTIAEVMERYAAGESISVLEKETGIGRRSLHDRMLTEIGFEAHEQLVTRALAAQVSEADEQQWAAKNMTEVSRASQLQRFTRMDLARKRPALYGEQKEKGEGATVVVVRLDPTCGGTVAIGILAGGVSTERVVTDEEALPSLGGGDDKEI